MFIIIVVYLGLCFWIALLGSKRKFGFWGYFFVSLFLTPIIGAIVLLGSDKQPEAITRCPACNYPLIRRP
jgi:hypothetical protein